MSDNIYGGILYPNSSFIIDKVYNNFVYACGQAPTDKILVGRYVLIAYTERPLPYATRQSIINGYDPDEELSAPNADSAPGDVYKYYLGQDGGVDYDRVICRKEYNSSGYTYTPIANLSTSMDWNVPSGSIEKETNGNIKKVIWCGKILAPKENTLENNEYEILGDTIKIKFNDIVQNYNITYINDNHTYGVFGENEFLKSFDTIAYNHLYGMQGLNNSITRQLTWKTID